MIFMLLTLSYFTTATAVVGVFSLQSKMLLLQEDLHYLLKMHRTKSASAPIYFPLFILKLYRMSMVGKYLS